MDCSATAFFRREFIFANNALIISTVEDQSSHRPRLKIRNVVIESEGGEKEAIWDGQNIIGHLSIVNIEETKASIISSHCIVYWNKTRGLPMAAPYDRDVGYNFAGTPALVPAHPIRAKFRSAKPVGNEATQVRRMLGANLYVMGWVRYADDVGFIRELKFCRVYDNGGEATPPRFYPVENTDYESED